MGDTRNFTERGSLSAPEESDVLIFTNDGFFTHYVCPECGHNDWTEGDARGEPITCPSCGLEGRIES